MAFTLGIHESVDLIFPPTVLRDALDPDDGADAADSDDGSEVRVVGSAAELEACDALVTFAYEDAFLSAGLSWIHSIQAGVDRFPFDELESRGIRLTNSTGIHGDAIGETVLGYMIQFARRLHRYRDRGRDGEWKHPEWDEPFTLSGESLCVVGLGTLGRGIAARADACGMEVVGVRRTPTPVDHVREVYTPGEIEAAVADARFVAVATPLTEETRGLIGADELAAMPESAYLLNVSRGGVVDETALLAELENDRLAGAALDVFETEPLPRDSPFWGFEDVIVTPHAAAATRDYYRRIADIVRENRRRAVAGESLVNQVI
ncbi:D-2-hydroxyacid dehydrogenase (NADP+) [Halorubrum aquaticum]|uniref:D-2-hydroxyacid dehydrogenase (NADP+) n=1 Tax=Halorubrum aquaticum TaxID=387340 RepID=A0A1I3AF11_9EURY|nr:D-2-hydroxyacid dehydrogenase [Halorubrum aquaticum]SFH48623.1 D-2-hydroxyacid dehydrogenase (NADP+) [Halorubrum aquaticum]